MTDLIQATQIFDTSAKLERASFALHKLVSGIVIDDQDHNDLTWTGQFLSGIRPSIAREPSILGGHLTVQATNARPAFYSSLLKVREEMSSCGLDTTPDIDSFFSNLVDLLLRGGSDADLLLQLGAKLDFASKLFRDISEHMLLELDYESAPPSPVF